MSSMQSSFSESNVRLLVSVLKVQAVQFSLTSHHKQRIKSHLPHPPLMKLLLLVRSVLKTPA